MIDASHIKVHPDAAGAVGGNHDMDRLNTKIHLTVDARALPVRAIITSDPRHDSKEACALIDGINSRYLLADRGYDSNHIIEFATKLGMECVIPPKKNRKIQRKYDKCATRGFRSLTS